MKKILLLSALLLGAVTVSNAGVRFDIGIPIPAPPVIVAPPAYVQPAPTYVQPAPTYVEPGPQVYVPPPVCVPPPVVVAPPIVRFRWGHEPEWRRFRNEFSYHHDFRPHYRHGYHHRW